jgi:hypothetical protein
LKSVLRSGRLEDLERNRFDERFHARAVIEHVGSGEVGLQRVDIGPFLHNGDDIRAERSLGGDIGRGVDRCAVFETSLFGTHRRNDLAKLGEEIVARAGVEFDRGNDVDHEAALKLTFGPGTDDKSVPRGSSMTG